MAESVDLQPMPFVSYYPLTFARSQHHPSPRGAATPAYELLFSRALGYTLLTPDLGRTTEEGPHGASLKRAVVDERNLGLLSTAQILLA